MARDRIIMGLIIICCLLLTSCGKSDLYSNAHDDKEIIVFAAASLTEVMNEMKEVYEAAHPGVRVVYNFAGSQVLRNQITGGAKPAMFFSANESYVDQLIEEEVNPYNDREYEGHKEVFATNRLVLLYANHYTYNSLEEVTLALGAHSYQPVILAQEEVPVGKYTGLMMQRFLESTGDRKGYDAFYNQVVTYESDVKAVVAKIRLGEGDLGVVYKTDAISLDLNESNLAYFEVDDSYNQIATYGGILFSNLDVESDFYEFVVKGDGQKSLREAGF